MAMLLRRMGIADVTVHGFRSSFRDWVGETTRFPRELKSNHLSGSFMVTFVRKQALESFLVDVVDPLSDLSADLIEKRQDFLKATTLPWAD